MNYVVNEAGTGVRRVTVLKKTRQRATLVCADGSQMTVTLPPYEDFRLVQRQLHGSRAEALAELRQIKGEGERT